MSENSKYIKSIYQIIFEKEFDNNCFTDIEIIQPLMYLLQVKGLHRKDYMFSIAENKVGWKTNNIFSIDLAKDINNIKEIEETFILNQERYPVYSLELFKKNLLKKINYNTKTWINCLAYVLYLMEHDVNYDSKIELIHKNLYEAGFDDEEDNYNAIQIISNYYFFKKINYNYNLEKSKKMLDEQILNCKKGCLCEYENCDSYPCWMIEMKEVMNKI